MQTSGVPENEITVGGGFSDYTIMYESESGYSVLYRVQKGGKRFALKGIKRELGSQAKYESILRREFDLHKNVTSIYCAECYELIRDPQVGLSIVMQYVDGITLNEWLKLKPGDAERHRVVSELLEAIGELHLMQIIHQDIKPANIIITNNGHHVKLIDFGLSDSDAYILKARGCTNKYASPELREGGEVTFASDVWSLGSIINDIFPHSYSCVKAKCHRTEPSRRYASVVEMGKALKRTDLTWRILGALLIVMVVAGAIIYGMMPHPSEKEIAYQKLVEETHAKYDSCYSVCTAKLDTCQYSEFSILYIGDFTLHTDSIRSAMMPEDSLQKILFYNDYMEYHKNHYVTLQDMAKDLPSIYTLPKEQRDIQHERFRRYKH